MHQPVFDGDVQQLLRRTGERGVKLIAHAAVVASQFVERRGQSAGWSCGLCPTGGSIPNAKQMVKGWMECVKPDGLAQEVPVEGFQMTDVKDDAVPFGNGPVVQRIRMEHSEQSIGIATCTGKRSYRG